MNGAYIATGENEGYAVIKDNLITVSSVISASQVNAVNIVSDTFEFEFADDSYAGNNIRKSISFKLSGSELTVQIAWHGASTKEIIFSKNTNIEFSVESPIQLDTPRDILLNNSGLKWSPNKPINNYDPVSSFLYNNGILGVGIEVKQIGKDAFELVGIRDFYPEPDCFFIIHIAGLDLPQGINIVKVNYLGGLFIRNSRIVQSNSSEAVYFSVIVDSQGNFTTTKI